MNSAEAAHILLADNDRDYLCSTAMLLRMKNYRVSEASSVSEAIEALREFPHLALIDLRLTNDDDTHDMSGLEVAHRAKDCGVSCIMMTAYPSVDTTRLALRSASEMPLAVDFVSKAHGPQPLLDAVTAVLSRRSPEPPKCGLVVDTDKRIAYLHGEQLKLSQYQYALLEYLYKQEGGICTHAELVRAIYGETLSDAEARNDRRLEGLVDRLRAKIEPDPSDPCYLLTIPWQGYCLKTNP